MIFGLCIKKDETFNYSKPLVIDVSDDKYFILQSIRDIDFSIIVQSMDNLKIYFVKYPTKDSYIKYNVKNITPENSDITILGNYVIKFVPNKINLSNSNKKINIVYELDKTFELSIYLTYIFRESDNDYILTTPFLNGNKSFLLK